MKYARENFPPFYKTHMSEIQRMMTAVVFAGPGRGGLANSPYADLLRDTAVEEESEAGGSTLAGGALPLVPAAAQPDCLLRV